MTMWRVTVLLSDGRRRSPVITAPDQATAVERALALTFGVQRRRHRQARAVKVTAAERWVAA